MFSRSRKVVRCSIHDTPVLVGVGVEELIHNLVELLWAVGVRWDEMRWAASSYKCESGCSVFVG